MCVQLPGGILDFLNLGARTAPPRNLGSRCGFQKRSLGDPNNKQNTSFQKPLFENCNIFLMNPQKVFKRIKMLCPSLLCNKCIALVFFSYMIFFLLLADRPFYARENIAS